MSSPDTKIAPRSRSGRQRRPLRTIDAALRKRIEEAVQAMIDALDALNAPAEDLEPEEDADDSAAPRAWRQELLDAMKEKAPERFRDEVRRYYEELVK